MYSLFTYDTLYDLSLGISKVMKESQFAYVSSGGVIMGQRKAVLWECTLLLSVIRRKSSTPTLRVDFAKGGVFSDVNRP